MNYAEDLIYFVQDFLEFRREGNAKVKRELLNDLKTLKKWEEYSFYKNQMFEKTSTKLSPWVIINSNNKMVARLNAMRFVLSKIDYKNKSELKNVSWVMDENNRDIKLFGVHFKNLDNGQYALLSKLKQLETTKEIKI